MTVRQRVALVGLFGTAVLVVGSAGAAVSSTNLVWAQTANAQKASNGNKILSWGGFYWKVKDTGGQNQEPSRGPWSSSPQNVWVDSSGALHLKVTVENGKRVSAQLDSVTPFSYGTFTWRVHLDANRLDPFTVLGLYTYGPSTRENTPNEIDIEHGRYGHATAPPSQFVVQPFQPTGHILKFNIPKRSVDRIESFTWGPRSIEFSMKDAHSGQILQQWSFTKASEVPVFLLDTLHINYWSYQPTKGALKPTVDEAVLDSFSWKPMISLQLPANSAKK